MTPLEIVLGTALVISVALNIRLVRACRRVVRTLDMAMDAIGEELRRS